ncbi:MAG TPA: FtsX-like permease family protein [Thermoanaerobaculia bacterium]|jgi:putative ABC transport system permease protein|nr:FtsX-like permease family protein [Thermoanaerobaculia bacterium]
MRFSKLVLRNLFRNKLRTLLTLVLMGAIFFFVTTLLSILANFEAASNAGEGQNRLGVQSAISLANPLPLSHEAKIQKIPGVVDTAKLQWMGAYYKEQKNFFANFAVDHDKMETVWDDYSTPKDQLEAFKADRTGAIVGPELMKRYGWKIGDKITLIGTIFPFNPEVTIRGIYKHKFDSSSFFIHFDYFYEATKEITRGTVGTFWARVRDPKDMAKISQQIDDMFKNSEYPTETFTEKEFQQQFMAMIGNIKLLFTVVSLCSIFMVVLLAALTMSMAARERVTEVAVLKAIGFTRGMILTLMLIEFITLGLLGGALGTFGAKFFYKLVNMTEVTQGFLVAFGVDNETVLTCLAAAAIVGFLAGGLPALRSARLSVVDGLRKVW